MDFEIAAIAVKNMKIGWNIGNSLDCCGLGHVSKTSSTPLEYERSWGNPIITKELILAIKEAGYNAIRVPVTYYEHMDQEGNVDVVWLNRVEEVVNYVLDADMYCITNVHHDTGAGAQAWLRADRKVYNDVKNRFVWLWEQIGLRFINYGEKLLFEGFNEMLDNDSSWDITDEDGYRVINCYNQLFVETVRGTGGNNRKRNLIVNTYGASPGEKAAKQFKIPDDTVLDHIIASIHFYKPDAFTAGTKELWDESGEIEINDFFECMNDYFISRGVPVIMGECGAHDTRSEDERVKYMTSVVGKAKQQGITYFWWDDGEKMRLIDRITLSWIFPKLQKAMVDAA